MTADIAKSNPPPRRSAEEDGELWARFRGVPGQDVKATPVHRLRIAGTAPEDFALHLDPVQPADPLRGEMLMKDVWRIGLDRLTLGKAMAPWEAELPSRHYEDRLHRFDWLPDLFTQGEAGAERARTLVDSWIENYGRFNGFAWRAGPTADRAWNWLRCGAALFETGEEERRHIRLDVLARQIRHLEALFDRTLDQQARWRIAIVLLAYAVCLRQGGNVDAALDRLDHECTAQLLPDGGHVSRAPSRTLMVAADLMTLGELLERAGHPAPDYFAKWVSRCGAMVAFFQLGDGALPPFSDGDESRPDFVEAVISRLDTPPRRFQVVPKSGYQKLQRGSVTLLLDAGRAPELPYGDNAHAGALGFEFSDGASRLVTSCGYSPEVDVDWQAAVRRTSAHSTLVLAGGDSAPFRRNEETRLLYPDGPEGISAKRLEEREEIWLDAQHGGYKQATGLLHRRRLFMSADGRKLTGEDSLARPVSQGALSEDRPIGFDIRFHLHPTVTAEAASDAIRLVTDEGRVWRFRTSLPGARLEKTVYLGRGVVERSQQIVLSGEAELDSDGTAPPNCVRWAFLQETP